MMRIVLIAVAVTSLCGAASGSPSWPKCAVRSGVEGGPAILVDGVPHVPLMFAGNNQFGRDEVLLEELRQAAKADIPLFSFNLDLDWYSSPQRAAELVAKFCEAQWDGYFYIRIWVETDADWCEAHPDECITKADGTRLSMASPSSTVWREEAARQLEDRLRQVIEGPYGARFIGVCPTYLQTGEWFYPDTDDFMDYSPANLRAFRDWLKKTYRRDKHLQAAWNDQTVTFETAVFPTAETRDASAWGSFRDPRSHQPAMDMQRFQSDVIVDTIAYFARAAKKATMNRSLVGVFYGYTMELNNNGARALAHSGHLALAKLLECDAIDLLHAPYSYFERRIGEPGHFHLPVDSVALHQKLAIIEEDTFTHLAQKPSDQLIAPGWRESTASLEETLAVARRNAAFFLTHRCGLWFFDLLSDGRWKDQTFWNATALLRRMAAELRGEPPFQPEVAFLVDEESVSYLRDTTHPLLLESLSKWRSELDRTGTPVGYYLQSDLPNLPGSVKVLILANPFRIDETEKRAIKKRLNSGATVLWTYAPDIVGPEGVDPSRIEATTGIPVAAAEAGSMSIVSELTGERRSMDRRAWGSRFIVPSEEGLDVVARYQVTGEVSAAASPAGPGVSLYTATPRLPVGLLREVFRRAGVHLYQDQPGMTGVVGPYLVVHTGGGLPDETVDDILADTRGGRLHTFSWPTHCQTVTRIVPYRPWPMRLESPGVWQDILPANTTAIYHCQ